MAWKLQSSETNGMEIFAVRARHIRLRAASDDPSWESSNTRQKRSCRYISHSVGSCEYSNPLLRLTRLFALDRETQGKLPRYR